jgi:hypothetical protein
MIVLLQRSSVDTPPSGYSALYAHTGGGVRLKNPAGAETAVGITLGTPIATTSGTSHDWTGIPAGVKRIVVSLAGVSTNGTSLYLVLIGGSGGIETTGYAASASNHAAQGDSTVGFPLMTVATAAVVFGGSLALTLVNAATNAWAAQGSVSAPGSGNHFFSAGYKALSSALDRVRLTTANGTDAFDAGLANIAYE